MKYILFDVAGTLLHKPSFYTTINEVLRQFGHVVDEKTIKYHHKILSESIFFPDRTSAEFYAKFNSELLYSVGIIPTTELLEAIFNSCSYLPWEPFEDTVFLKEINIPIGIISNFNATLREKLPAFFDVHFADVFVSEEMGVAKPSADFYAKALQQIGIDPKQIVYVGDSIKLDLEPALKLGIKALLIDREQYFPEQSNSITTLSDLKKFL